MLKIIVSACLLSLVESQQWTAHLGQQYPGVTPLFSPLDDGIAIASLLQDSNRTFHLLVHRYSIYGKLEAKCDVVVPAVSKRIWDLKAQRESDSSLAVSWLYSDGAELGVRVLRVNVTRCDLRDARVALYGDLDLVLYVPYYLLPRGDAGGLYLFVKSPEVCEGVCRFEIGRDGQTARRDGTFTTAQDDSLVWRILAVNPNDPSSGYYYISEDDPKTQLARVEKLNFSGTLLRARRTRHNVSADAFAVSSSHARLSVCSSSGCFLLDPDTFESTVLNVSAKVATVVNAADAGVVVVDEDNTAREYYGDGTTSESVVLFEGFNAEGKCFPRKMYPAFELTSGVYCTGRPCMRKSNASSDVFYRVSVAVECVRIPRAR